jgi:outer membrane protein insertion porin family
MLERFGLKPRPQHRQTHAVTGASHHAVTCTARSPKIIPEFHLSSTARQSCRPDFHARRVLIGLWFLFACLAQLHAQTESSASKEVPRTAPSTEQLLGSYEGQSVSSLEIAGRPDLKASQFSPAFAQQAGQPFSKEKVDQTAAALEKAGKFQAVRIQVQPDSNGLRVIFVLEPATYIGIFQFPGAGRYAYSRLLQVANYPVQTAFNARDIEQDRQSLLTFFQQQGFFQAEVRSDVQVDSEHAIANVIFRTTLGPRAKFGSVEIEGAPLEDAARLRQKLTTWIARGKGAAIRPGKNYRYGALNKAAQYLQSIMQKQGFLGAQVRVTGAEYHADTNAADIHFSANPGVKTQVKVEGSHLWPWTKKSLLPVYQGVQIDDESVQEGEQALVSYFQKKGFYDVKVDSKLDTANSGDTVLYQITKGKKHKVTAIELSGNKTIASSQLRPQIVVTKKHFLSSGDFNDQLVRSSVNNLEAVYQSEGFSSVKVASAVARNEGNVQVTFRVTEGPRDIVNSIKVEGADTMPPAQYAPGGLKLAAGRPYSQAYVKSDRANIVAHYLQAGYLNASFRETAAEVSKNDPHRINVVYHIYEGPKVAAGEILTLGRGHTKQRLINESIKAIRTEQPLTETELLTAGSRLYDRTGVFDWAEVDPKRDITTQTSEDVLVKVHEAKRNEFTYGIGFEVINRGGSVPGGTVVVPGLPPVGLPSNFVTSEVTYYGPRGSILYSKNNMRGEGETLSLTAFAGRLDQRGAFYYIVPHINWSSWKATGSVSAEHNEENPVYSSQEEIGSLQFQKPLDKLNQKIFFFRYSFSKTDLTHIVIPDLVPPEDQHVRLSTLSWNLTRDTRDNPLDEHKGVLQSLEVNFNSSKLGSNVDFAKLTGQAAFYKQGFHKIVWANSIRIGMAQAFNNSFVPLSEAFFTGGSNSLRGYPLDGAGPQRQVLITGNGCTPANPCSIQVPAGGNELLLINSEARIPLPIKKGLGLVVFYDGGNVFPQIGFHQFTELYSNNVGLGLRYATPVGPIRIDVGQNLNPVQGIKSTQYFITIGQAF